MSEDQSLEKGSKGQEETVYSVCLVSGKGFLLSMVEVLGVQDITEACLHKGQNLCAWRCFYSCPLSCLSGLWQCS